LLETIQDEKENAVGMIGAGPKTSGASRIWTFSIIFPINMILIPDRDFI
jgi:hypothetical protein